MDTGCRGSGRGGQARATTDPLAVCWCVYGARRLELAEVKCPALRRRLNDEKNEMLHEAANSVSPSAVNDDRSASHGEVLAMIRRAGMV